MTGIFASLFGTTPKLDDNNDTTRAGSSDSTITEASADVNSNEQSSSSSTPPTSIGDSVSISSASSQTEKIQVVAPAESPGRSRRQRTSVGTYNVKVLSGTAIHAPRKYLKDKQDSGKTARRRTVGGEPLSHTSALGEAESHVVSDGLNALNLEWPAKQQIRARSQYGRGSPRKARKVPEATRTKTISTYTIPATSLTKKSSILGKRRRTTGDEVLNAPAKVKRELKNLADTKEFAKIDTQPIIHEVWSNGKLVTGTAPAKRTKAAILRERAKSQKGNGQEEVKAADTKTAGRKKEKIWLPMGLYAGQVPVENLNWFTAWNGPKDQEKNLPPFKPDGALPLPMWHGQRNLYIGKDFKLPFDVCSPLPPGQPKPDEWHKTSSNRFVGDAGALWKKSSLFDSFSSKCVCTPEFGCDEDCQNRIMLYECDDTNCASGRDRCTNRAFAQLQERRKGGGKYRIGVEVIKTSDRGYGVRSNRCFEPHQIIVEYTGEIITEDECDRRMNEDYKDNKCYYLMSFDQNMIIDATKGSIARFVNHSCRPNCRMVKWIVGGKPRMALFAGDSPIMSGDELTYDYNFDPFSAKNVQECLCGSDNCRGVLGPKPKDPKPVKEALKDAVKATVKAGKRKLQQILGVDDRGRAGPAKKRKLIKATASKRSYTRKVGRKVATKRSTTIVKKAVSSRFLTASTVSKAKAKRGLAGPKKTKKRVVIKTYKRVAAKHAITTPIVERKSPRSKSRRSYREYLEDENNQDEETDVESISRGSGQKGKSIFEGAGTIRVMTEVEE